MTFDTAFVIKVFAALFAIMNPVSNVSVFLALTEGMSAAAQRQGGKSYVWDVGGHQWRR